MLSLVKLANKKLINAYCPYSNFPVSCLIVLKDKTMIYGVNVENASYGGTICAERNAFTTFVTEGYKKGDVEVVVITSKLDDITPPCGICRQFMLEFVDNDTPIILANEKEKFVETNLEHLVPYQFKKESLGV